MSNGTLNINTEEQEEKDNIVAFEPKIISGGKEPPSTGETWLERMEVGTVFLIQDKQNPMDFNLGLFRLAGKEGKAYILITPSHKDPASGEPIPMYVNPTRFCNKFICYEEMAVAVNPGEQKDVGE